MVCIPVTNVHHLSEFYIPDEKNIHYRNKTLIKRCIELFGAIFDVTYNIQKFGL